MNGKPTLTERTEKLEKALGLRPKRGLVTWIRESKGEAIGTATLLVTVVALIIAYLAWWQPQWNSEEDERLSNKIRTQVEASFKDHKIDEMATDIAATKAQVATMLPFLQILTQKQMQTTAKLSPPQFEDHLPELKATLAAARTTSVQTPEGTLNIIQTKLAQSSRNQPEFWGTAAALISYRSSNSPKELNACALTDESQHLTWKQIDHLETKGTPPPDQVTFDNCHLDLDSVPVSRFPPPTPTDAISIVCKNCRVTYSGGSIPLFGVKGYVNIILQDCSFLFEASNTSPVKGKGLIEAVLTSKNSQNVHYDFSKS